MFRSLISFIISLFFYVSLSFGQEKSFTIFKGIILNNSTGELISYASVGLFGSSVNTMSNEKGEFIFKIPARRGNDSVNISHVGYKPVRIFVNPSDTGFTIIKLQEAVTQLADVVIKKIDPLELIKKAVSSIPENYPQIPYRLNGFYRLTGTKEKRVIHLSEAVFGVYHESYSGRNSQFNLIKSRVDKDLTAFNGSDNVEIGLDPAAIFSVDIVNNIKNSELLGEQGLKDHQFIFKGLVNYNGQEAYEILFDEKDGIKKALYQGKILIDADNLAFLEFDIRLSQKGLKYYSWGFLQKMMINMAHISLNILSDNQIITYRKYGSKYYLNHVNTVSVYYLAGGKKHFLLDPLVNKTNYLVTKIDTAGVEPYSKDEILGNSKRIESRSKIINDTKDSPDRSDTTDLFWENYNLIQAEFNVDSAVAVIQANNATLSYKEIVRRLLQKYKRDKITGIDSILSFYHRKDQFNGSALIQYEGKIIFEKGFGMADKELKIPNTSETQFRIGSTSKQFTSMLIMQLVDEKKLSVHDTIGKFLPGYVHGSLTVEQLLTHQSGIPNYTDIPNYLAKIISRKYAVDELVSQFCSDSLEFQPGTQFQYSNSNYVVLADVVEKLTGKPYSDVLAQKIFKPLGMNHSFFVSGADGDKLAKGYINDQPENPYPVGNVTGAGGITSTAEDLLIWSNALDSNKLLNKENMNELFLPRVEWKDWDAYYGYGWMIDRDLFRVSNKHKIFYHPGTEFGFYDMLLLQQDKGVVVILLNNTGDFPRFDMTDLILDELN
jgi:CubicO group peptidase (beta-lactamase class C family)